MNKIYFYIIVLSCIAGVISCVEEEKDEPVLELSEEGAIMFSKEGAEKTITVMTNQQYWTAISNVNWLEMLESGDVLTIKATENKTADMRKAQVKVLSGGIGKTLEITQTASDVVIVTFPEGMEILQWRESFIIDVEANISDWGISSDEDWIELIPRPKKDQVSVTVHENKSREDRIAKLTLSGSEGKGAREFIIKQSGIMFYIFPFLEFGAAESDITSFEIKRRSEILDASADGKSTVFKTLSEAFGEINYVINTSDKTYKEAFVHVTMKDFFEKELTGFVKFLKDNGFEEAVENVYTNESQGVQATISTTDAQIHYKRLPKQPEDMPTFDAFPYGLINFEEATTEDVENYETANGGVLDSESSSSFRLYNVTGGGDLANRAYRMKPKVGENVLVLSESMHFFKKQSLAFYEFQDEILLTKEFKALLDREGFVLYNSSKGRYRFENKEKNIRLSVRWGVMGGIDEKMVELTLFPLK